MTEKTLKPASAVTLGEIGVKAVLLQIVGGSPEHVYVADHNVDERGGVFGFSGTPRTIRC